MKLVLVAAALSAVSYAQIDMSKITDCSGLMDECRSGPNANQATCVAANAQCEQCQIDYNQCRAPGNGVSGNQAGCAAQVAACVGSAFPQLSSSASTTTTDSEPCQTTYKSCVDSGKNEELCGCDLATCTGEDNARTRDYCAKVSATAAAPSSTATASASSSDSDDCQSTYKACVAGGESEELCGCDLATCTGEDNARTREYCAAVSASAAGSAPTSTATAAADSDDCQATWRQCVAGGRAEELCSCDLAVCTGEDSARNRAYCATLSATATGAAAIGTATGLATSGVARPTSAVGGVGSNSTSSTPIVTGAAASVGVSVLGAASAFVSYLLM